MEIGIFETYNNYVITHVIYIYQTTHYMDMGTMWACPPSQHALTHWTCVLRCCENFPPFATPIQESDKNNSNISPTIHSNI